MSCQFTTPSLLRLASASIQFTPVFAIEVLVPLDLLATLPQLRRCSARGGIPIRGYPKRGGVAPDAVPKSPNLADCGQLEIRPQFDVHHCSTDGPGGGGHGQRFGRGGPTGIEENACPPQNREDQMRRSAKR